MLHGRARLTEGGAAELLQRLAHVYLGPDVRFPAMPDPPAGWVIRVAVERIVGVGPWTSGEEAERQLDRRSADSASPLPARLPRPRPPSS